MHHVTKTAKSEANKPESLKVGKGLRITVSLKFMRVMLGDHAFQRSWPEHEPVYSRVRTDSSSDIDRGPVWLDLD